MLSPEYFIHNGVDGMSDVWTLGLLLHRMVLDFDYLFPNLIKYNEDISLNQVLEKIFSKFN